MEWKRRDFFSLEGCPCPEVFKEVTYPWEVLAKIPTLITKLVEANPGDYDQIAPEIWIGKDTTIADTARFLGPAVIGKNCQIGPNAYIRENVIAGDGVMIGHTTEVKQAILFAKVQLPHFNYVGDSILGYGSHLGAGAIISNFKSTKETVRIRWGEEVLETGLRKLGAILGDEVEVGCNAVLNPGTLIGTGSLIYPLSSVRGYVPEGM
ncbi:MAG: UDP-N-acetylglucosamine pyrophosphorylase, partial [Firmicutes bacterium]|nr:UDP-N-acetylglucosamine pyrophosphorylase [Bacillota bacterium]